MRGTLNYTILHFMIPHHAHHMPSNFIPRHKTHHTQHNTPQERIILERGFRGMHRVWGWTLLAHRRLELLDVREREALVGVVDHL